MSLDDKLKNMTLSELLDKEKQLKIYLAKVEKEIANHKKSGSRGSAENTFPMQLFSSSERTKSVEKPKPKPKSKPKNLGELARETRNEKPVENPKIKATMDSMKEVLTANKVKYTSNMNKEKLSELIRSHNLVRICESYHQSK